MERDSGLRGSVERLLKSIEREGEELKTKTLELRNVLSTPTSEGPQQDLTRGSSKAPLRSSSRRKGTLPEKTVPLSISGGSDFMGISPEEVKDFFSPEE